MRVDSESPMSRRIALAGLSAFLAGCSRVGFLAANVPAVFGAYKRHPDIAYGSGAQHRLADVYEPRRAAGAPRPVGVFWHGGRWSAGDKADYRFVGAALAQAGYIAVLPNYRHYPQVKMPGFMDDTAQAALWSAAHAGEFGADPKRLYLMGHSAGAHMAVLVTLDARYFAATGRPAPRIAGVIGLSGPYDFLPLREADVQDMFGPPPIYPQSQPINFVRADAPPMLLVHGLDDTTAWPKNSRNLAAALSALGVPVTLKLYPKTAHVVTVAALTLLLRQAGASLADTTAFIPAREHGRSLLFAVAGAAIWQTLSEAIRQKGLQRGSPSLANRRSASGSSPAQHVEHRANAARGGDLNGAADSAADRRRIDLVGVGLLHQLPAAHAAHRRENDHHVLQRYRHGVLENVLEQFAPVAQPQIIQQRLHDGGMAGIANGAVIEVAHLAGQGLAQCAEAA